MQINNKIKVFISLILFLIFFYLLFFQFSKKVVSYTLKRFVLVSSDSIYYLNFDKSQVNIFTQSYLLTNFQLIPDTNRIKEKGIKKNFYKITLDTLYIGNLNLLKLLKKDNSLSIKKVFLYKLQIDFLSLKKNSDTTKQGYKKFSKDVINTFFRYVKKIEIDSFKLIHTNIRFIRYLEPEIKSFNAKDISLIFDQLQIDKNTFTKFNKIFYNSLELHIAGYRIPLADNIHILTSENLVLNTRKSIIYLKNFSIKPILRPKDKKLLFIDVKDIKLEKIDFRRFFENKQLIIKKAYFDKPSIIFYDKKNKIKKDSLKLEKLNIYPLYKKYLKSIAIDTILVEKGHYEQYFPKDIKPQIKIDSFDISMYEIYSDSITEKDTSRILFSKNFKMDFWGFRKRTADSIHIIYSQYLKISTFDRQIISQNFGIIPINYRLHYAKSKSKSFNKIIIPYVNFEGIDLNKLVYLNTFILKKIYLLSPKIEITNFSDSIKKARSKNVLKQLSTNLINYASIGYVNIQKGIFNIKTVFPQKHISSKGKLSLKLKFFYFNPKQKKIHKFFFANSVNLKFTNYQYKNSNSLQVIEIDSLGINTDEKSIKINSLKIKPNYKNIDSLLVSKNKSLILDLYLPNFQISNFDANEYFLNNKLIINNLSFSNPKIKILFYPEIYARKEKINFIKNYKKKVVDTLINISSRIKVELYAKLQSTDDTVFEKLNYQTKLIDSILNQSIKIIKNYPISTVKINLSDKKIKEIDLLKDSTIKYLKKLDTLIIETNKADKIVKRISNFLIKKYQQARKPKFTQKDIVNSLKKIIDIIQIDTAELKNSKVEIVNKSLQKDSIIFNNTLDIRLYKFYFNKDSTDSLSKRLFLSDSFNLAIKNLELRISDNIHIARIKQLNYFSKDSTLRLKLINISPLYKRKNAQKTKIYGFIKAVSLKGFKSFDFLFKNKLIADTLIFYESGIYLNYYPKAQKVKTKIKDQIFLPPKISKINLKVLKFKETSITISKTDKILGKTSFNLSIFNINIDSVFYPKKNLYFIPIDSFNLEAFNSAIFLKKHNLSFDSLRFSSKNRNFSFKNLNFQSKDSLLKIFLTKGKLLNFNLKDFRFEKEINFNKLKISKFLYHSEKIKPKSNKKIKLQEIDLYEKIKKITPQINFNKLQIDTLEVKTPKQSIKNLSLEVDKFLLNKDSKITEPLFYSDNIILKYKNYSKLSKDSLYRLKIGQITFQSKGEKIELDSLSYKPLYSFEETQKRKSKFRITVADIFLKKIALYKFDIIKFTDSNKIMIDKIFIKDGIFNLYTDLRVPHNDSIIKKHYIELLLDLKQPTEINQVIFSNLNINYTEINNKTQLPAQISINKLKGNIINLTNDTAKINKNDLSTILNLEGYLQNEAYISLKLEIPLKERGNFTKLSGKIGKCEASIFNSYTENALSLKIEEGTINKGTFNMITKDSIAIGKMLLLYDNLKTSMLKGDKQKEKRKFFSWIANIFVVKTSNPRYGIFYKYGAIGYIHNPSYSDIKLWVRGLTSGILSTLLYEAKDVKKIKRKYRFKVFKEMFPELFK